MFTGIVRETGRVAAIEASGGIYRLEIRCKSVSEGASAGDSVAVNGVCLTVTRKSAAGLSFDVMAETAARSTVAGLKAGEAVNLEGALRAGAPVDGHFVLGHVDCVGTVRAALTGAGRHEIRVAYPEKYDGLVVEKGSVAIDGVSLTVGRAGGGELSVFVIPHTLGETTLGSRRAGDSVNIEFDILGKYALRAAGKRAGNITEEFLRSKGF